MKQDALVYVDRKRVMGNNPQEEYIHRMNMEIEDAVNGAGVPFAYVQKVMRPFIPEQKKAEESARKQALSFEDRK